MWISGLVVIAALLSGTFMVIYEVSPWYIAWPVGLSVLFTLLMFAHVGAKSKRGGPPWPEREA